MLDRLTLLARMLPALRSMLAYQPSGRTTVADRIEERAARHPEYPFLVFGEQRLSYGELNAAANRLAHWGWHEGLRPGDVVALLMENRPEYVVTWAGLAKIGVTVALLNTHVSGHALAHALAAAGTSRLVAGSECLDRLAGLSEESRSGLELWVQREPGAPAEASELPEQARDLDAAVAGAPESDPDRRVREGVRCGDDLFYIYTSGTTGLPKAARMSHLRFLAAGDGAATALSLGPGDVHFCALPLYHSAGGAMLVSTVLASGATVALERRFSASRFWDEVRRTHATCFQYIGEFCRYLMQQPPRPDDRDHEVRAIIGNGLRADLWEPFQRRFGIERIIEFYSATESNTAVANLENRPGSVGRFPFRWATNARLVRYDVERDLHPRDEKGFCIECEPGEVGEFVGRIPRGKGAIQGRFEGYTSRRDTERKILRDVFHPGDAWFRSGDLLRQDDEGFFYFVDRIGDTFRWKGENVSTQEVENALAGLPALAWVNVYGVRVEGADGRAGMAALQLAPDADFDGKVFYDFATSHLPRYAVPAFVRLLPELDLTGTFKLRKGRLQEEGFDLDRVSDPLFVRDDEARAYLPLTRALAEEIVTGERRI